MAKIDTLKYLLNKETLIGRITKLVRILSEFDIEYVDQKTINEQIIVDQLVDARIVEDHPLLFDLIDEVVFMVTTSIEWKCTLMSLTHNMDEDQKYSSSHLKGMLFQSVTNFYFPCMKNIVEYKALIICLRTIVKWRIKNIYVYGDSRLVVGQIKDDIVDTSNCSAPTKINVANYSSILIR